MHLSGKKPLLKAYIAPIIKNFQSAIFYNICFRTNVLSEIKIKAFSTILKDPASDNCLLNIGISNSIMNFNLVCYLIRRK